MPIIDLFYRFCDFENMALCSLNVIKQQSIVCWNMLWWKYALVKICCGPNMLWWKYAVVKICYGENILWWKYSVVKIFCGGRKYAKVLFPPPSDAFRLLKHPGAFVFGNRENASFLWIISKFSVNYFPNVVIFTCMIHVLLVKIMQMTVLFLLTNHQFDNTQ